MIPDTDFTTMRARLQKRFSEQTAGLHHCPQCGREGVMHPSIPHNTVIVHKQGIRDGKIILIDFCVVKANETKTALVGVSSHKED